MLGRMIKNYHYTKNQIFDQCALKMEDKGRLRDCYRLEKTKERGAWVAQLVKLRL